MSTHMPRLSFRASGRVRPGWFARLLVFTFIFSIALPWPAMTGAASGPERPAGSGAALPTGFIAVAQSRMNWSDAVAYCTSQGGRLPKIKGESSLSMHTTINDGDSIEGFGAHGAPWPAGLRSGMYWTGTEDSARPGYSWSVSGYDGVVDFGTGGQVHGCRVACVP